MGEKKKSLHVSGNTPSECFSLWLQFLILILYMFKDNIKSRSRTGQDCSSPRAWSRVRNHSTPHSPLSPSLHTLETLSIRLCSFAVHSDGCSAGVGKRRCKAGNQSLALCKTGQGRNKRFHARRERGFLGNPMDPTNGTTWMA